MTWRFVSSADGTDLAEATRGIDAAEASYTTLTRLKYSLHRMVSNDTFSYSVAVGGGVRQLMRPAKC